MLSLEFLTTSPVRFLENRNYFNETDLKVNAFGRTVLCLTTRRYELKNKEQRCSAVKMTLIELWLVNNASKEFNLSVKNPKHTPGVLQVLIMNSLDT